MLFYACNYNHKILKIKEFNNFDVAVGRFLMWQLAVLKTVPALPGINDIRQAREQVVDDDLYGQGDKLGCGHRKAGSGCIHVYERLYGERGREQP